MLLVQPVREVARFLPVLVGLVVAGSAGGLGGLQLAGVAVPILLGVARWVTTTYRISAGRVELRRGLLSRRVLSVPLDRVRTVDLTAPAVHRLVGVTIVRIGTGAASADDALDLDGLDTGVARDLRSRLLAAGDTTDEEHGPGAPSPASSRPSDPSSPPGVVAAFDPRWLRYAPLTGSGVVVVAALAAAVGQVLNTRDLVAGLDPRRWQLEVPVGLAVLLGVVVAAVVVVSVSVLGYLLTNGRFTLRRSPRSWQVSRGLVTTRETTLDVDRVAGVALGEPLALRMAGGAHLSAIVTGVDRSQRGSATLLPPAPARVVEHAAAAVLGDDTPLTTTLRAHGRQACRRRWVRAVGPAAVAALLVAAAVAAGAPRWLLALVPGLLIPAAALAHDRARGLGHALLPGHLVARAGSLARRREVLELDHVIGWSLRSTVWQRRAGLTTLVATTAGGSGRVTVTDVPRGVAVAVAGSATPGLLDPFVADGLRPGGVEPAPTDGGTEAERGRLVHVSAPFWGEITPHVAVGDVVEAGQPLATIEAVKLSAPITAPSAGTVTWLAPARTGTVRGGDLVAVLGPAPQDHPPDSPLSPGRTSSSAGRSRTGRSRR